MWSSAIHVSPRSWLNWDGIYVFCNLVYLFFVFNQILDKLNLFFRFNASTIEMHSIFQKWFDPIREENAAFGSIRTSCSLFFMLNHFHFWFLIRVPDIQWWIVNYNQFITIKKWNLNQFHIESCIQTMAIFWFSFASLVKSDDQSKSKWCYWID